MKLFYMKIEEFWLLIFKKKFKENRNRNCGLF